MKKKIFIYLLLIILFISMIYFVYPKDDSLKLTNNDSTFIKEKITDNYIKIKTDKEDIMDVQLIYNTEYCEEHCEFILNITNDYNSKKDKDKEKIDKVKDFKKEEYFYMDYDKLNTFALGLKSINYYVSYDYEHWIEVNYPQIMNISGNYYLKAIGIKYKNSFNDLDWKPTFYGIKISEWAEWISPQITYDDMSGTYSDKWSNFTEVSNPATCVMYGDFSGGMLRNVASGVADSLNCKNTINSKTFPLESEVSNVTFYVLIRPSDATPGGCSAVGSVYFYGNLIISYSILNTEYSATWSFVENHTINSTGWDFYENSTYNYTIYSVSGNNNITSYVQYVSSGGDSCSVQSFLDNVKYINSGTLNVTLITLNASYINSKTYSYQASVNISGTNSLTNSTINIWNTTGFLIGKNSTTISGTYNLTNITANVTNDGIYYWNILANDYYNESFYSDINYTITIDTIDPVTTINSITTTQGSQTITFNSSSSDTNLDSCWYSVYNSSGMIDPSTTENESFTCNTNKAETVSAYGTYTLRVYTNDSATNLNYTEDNFTTSPTPPGSGSPGGGGGTTTTIETAKNYSISSLNRLKRIDLSLAKDSKKSRTKQFIITNTGTTEINVDLVCESTSNNTNICDYVVINQTRVQVSPNENDPYLGSFTVLTPENASLWDEYYFNILAINEEGATQEISKLSVSSKVTLFGYFYKWVKWGERLIPIALISVLVSIILFAVVFGIFIKRKMELTGLILSIILFFASFFLITALT